MSISAERLISADLASELERKYFWWDPIGLQPRSEIRILAQAMSLASFNEVRRLETIIGPSRLADVMLRAEAGWISDRSWEFWRGRLGRTAGKAIPEAPPRRTFDAGVF
jgi:hypothetical protein